MRRPALVLLLACALLACEKQSPPEEPTAPAAARPVDPAPDGDNLLNLAYGASVVSRTGETNLEQSAVHAIDGMFTTVWASAPGVTAETLLYSMLAPSRISHVGITPVRGDELPRRVRFEASLDGRIWSELATIAPENRDERQLFPARETVARYVRVQPLEQQTYYVRARGFHVIGGEVAPPDTPPFTGCWTVNGRRAQLVQDGARITGVIEAEPPIHLDGGTDNRVAMVMWMQGPTWGYAALSRTPDGAHIAGLRFYEEPDSRHVAEGWMGDRCHAGGAARPLPPAAFLQRAGRYSAFGVAFDREGRLLEPLSTAALDTIRTLAPRRIEVREYAFDDHAQNRARAAAKIAALRRTLQARGMDVAGIEFVAVGSESAVPDSGSTVQRVLASRIDIIPPP